MKTEYKVIPFTEVKIGQEFEDALDFDQFTDEPWIKTGVNSYKVTCDLVWDDGEEEFNEGCLVRIADCEPELDFDTWWELKGEHNVEWTDHMVEDMCKAAWEAGRAK